MEEINSGEIWQHFKGGIYKIIGIAKDSRDLKDLVIYEAQYKNELSQLWARPISEFFDYKELDDKKVRRYKKMK